MAKTSSSVFINCPFDEDYKSILDAIVFALLWFDFEPVMSRTINGASHRLSQICELIQDASLSIHDLSRMVAEEKGSMARMNMPFELGLDYGCIQFASRKDKMLLILDSEQHRYQRAISDLSGNDIFAHHNDPRTALRKVVEWLQSTTAVNSKTTYGTVWLEYNKFRAILSEFFRKKDIPEEEIDSLPLNNYKEAFKAWRNKSAS